MTLGQKIKKLRLDKNLTQKDLAERVYVTFQTVSKWENDENEPDVSTLRELSKLFGCSLDYLLNEEQEEPKEELKIAPVVAPAEQVTKTIIIHQKELHVCRRCKKDISEDDLEVEQLTKSEPYGRVQKTVSAGEAYYHKSCWEEELKERAENEKRAKAAYASRAKKLSFGWGIFGGVVALGIALAIFLNSTQEVHPALGVLYSVLIGYGIFAMLYCIISGSYIGEVFEWCAGLSVKFPGLIFSWDIDGFIWVIAMKILFGIIAFFVGVFALLFAIVFSGLLGSISFPFVLIHNNNNGYADSL